MYNNVIKKCQIPKKAHLMNLFDKDSDSLYNQIKAFFYFFFLCFSPVWLLVSIGMLIYTGNYLLLLPFFYIILPNTDNVRKWDIWNTFTNHYFTTQVIFENKEDFDKKSSPYIVSLCPHGVIPLCVVPILCGKLTENVFKDIRAVVANAAFYLFAFRSILIGTKSISAKEDNIVKALKNKENLTILPGGIKELFYADEDNEYINIKSRKKFIKLAIQGGSDILPVYVFGSNDVYNMWPFFKYAKNISRKFRIGIAPFYGRWGLPISVPNRIPLLYVIGERIECKKNTNPTEKEINEKHELYMSTIKRIFYDYKNIYNGGSYKNKELVII
jgi:2-acylglycerol O-acyltransferase 2